ncbi:MAG: ABC transporter ATP-binding protein [Butyrivibrio sp.]|nr:ABC transporter ATP-binding protein [Butyrivibrio sp.]
MGQKWLECRDLSCGYGAKAADNKIIKNISFFLEEGESLAILGANGSGKTTLLRAIGGLLPYEGEIILDGREVRDMKRKEIAAKLAAFSQLSGVYFSYTIKETVMQGRYLYCDNLFGMPGKRDEEVVEECLRDTGLLDIADKQIGQLSGGQLQRVFLARTLAQRTPTLLLDEPSNHLDLKYQAELLEFLNRWRAGETACGAGAAAGTTGVANGARREVRNTLIGVYHDINMGLLVADKFLLLKDGEILSFGSKEETITASNLEKLYDIDVEKYMKSRVALWM